MRIINIVDTLNPNSGVFDVIYTFHQELLKKGHQIDYIYLYDTERNLKNTLLEQKSKVLKVNTKDFLKNKRKVNKQVKKFIGNHDEDLIVHNHVLLLSNLMIPVLKKHIKKATYIGHAHSSSISNSFIKKIRNKIMIIGINKYYNQYWGCSKQAVGTWFGKKIVSSRKYSVIPNPVNCKKIEEAKRYKIRTKNKESITLGTVGRLEQEKNQLFLLDIVKEITKKEQSVELIIIGEGSLYGDLIKKAKNLNISSKILLIEYLPKDKLYRKMLTFDFFLFPSQSEGLGNVLIEAQMLGVNSFAHDALPSESSLGKVSYLPLDVELWTEKILMNFKNKNYNFNYELTSHKYCIKESANILEEKYLPFSI